MIEMSLILASFFVLLLYSCERVNFECLLVYLFKCAVGALADIHCCIEQ